MAYELAVPETVESGLRWAFVHPEISAPVFVFLASYFLYGVLGKRALGADDDYWELVRKYIISFLQSFASASGAYVRTKSLKSEKAGYVEMGEEQFEHKLEQAGYLRQIISSKHYNENGWAANGSWSRTVGPLFPVERVILAIENALISLLGDTLRAHYIGRYTRRFIKSLNTILALRQHHVVFYTIQHNTGGYRTYLYCHTEWNPLNPLVAVMHYYASGSSFKATPEVIVSDMDSIGVEVKET